MKRPNFFHRTLRGIATLALLGVMANSPALKAADEKYVDPPSGYDEPDAKPALPPPSKTSPINRPIIRTNVAVVPSTPAQPTAPSVRPKPNTNAEQEPAVRPRPTIDPPVVQNPLPSPDEKNSPSGKTSEIIRVGDYLRITFSGPPDPPANQDNLRVGESKTISLDHLKVPIPVANLTVEQVAQNIQTAYLKGGIYQYLTVQVLIINRTYHVSGEVKTPGTIPFTGEITVTRAITAAGDFTIFANRKKIEITRANGQVERVNWNDARKNPLKYDVPIYANDRIYVPEKPY